MARLVLLLVMVFPATAVAQPQGQVLWSHHATDGVCAATMIEDLDGDSISELVGLIHWGRYLTNELRLYCLSGASGDSLWSSAVYWSYGNKGLGTSEDLNGDGVQDVILGTVGTYIPPGRSCIAIDGATGTNLWVFPFGEERGWCYTVKAFRGPDGTPVDLDGDSVPEILASAGGVTNDRRGTAIALSGRTGDSLWAFRPARDGAQCIAPFADVDADSVPDVLVGAGGNGFDNRVFCLSGTNGDSLWAYGTDNSVQDVEQIQDVNSSGLNDCIAGGWADSVYCLEGKDGSLIWAADIGTIVMEVVPCRDLDGDSVMDVLVGSWSSSIYVLSGADGSIVWSGPVGANVWAVDTLADVTGDGMPEVAAGCLGSGTGVAKVFDGTNGDVLWSFTFNERVYDVTGVADVNGDGHADLAVGLQDHHNQTDHFYCFSGQAGSALSSLLNPQPRGQLELRYDPATGRALVSAAPGVRYTLWLVDAAGRTVGPSQHGIGRFDWIPYPVASRRLAAGSYYLLARTHDGTASTHKIIISGAATANP